VKQLDHDRQQQICPECHVAVLYRREEAPGLFALRCPTCGYTVLTKKKKDEHGNEEEAGSETH
jgi:DNA-directed RNA polymerase subunit RPC12/RpoP